MPIGNAPTVSPTGTPTDSTLVPTDSFAPTPSPTLGSDNQADVIGGAVGGFLLFAAVCLFGAYKWATRKGQPATELANSNTTDVKERSNSVV